MSLLLQKNGAIMLRLAYSSRHDHVMHVHLFPLQALLLDKLHILIYTRLLGAAEPPPLLHQVLYTAPIRLTDWFKPTIFFFFFPSGGTKIVIASSKKMMDAYHCDRLASTRRTIHWCNAVQHVVI